MTAAAGGPARGARSRVGTIALVAVFACGLWLRLDGLATLATYIDETIVLSGGYWTSADGPMGDARLRNPVSYALGFALSRESSYAPLQFLVTWFAVRHDHLSREALIGARLVSVAFGAASFVVLVWILRLAGASSLSMILPLAVFWLSDLFAFHSRLTYNYASVVLGAALLLWLFARLGPLSTAGARATLGVSAAAAIWLHFQLLYVVVACAVALALHERRVRQTAWIRALIDLRLAAAPIAVSLGFMLAVLVGLKRDLTVAWWLRSYVPDHRGVWQEIGWFLVRLLEAVRGVVRFEGTPADVVGVALFVMGLAVALRERRTAEPPRRILADAALLSIALCAGAYATRRSPLSPTRHALVYLVPITVFVSVAWDAAVRRRPAFTAVGLVAAAAVGTAAIAHHVRVAPATVETLDAGALAALEGPYARLPIVLTPWDTDKLRVFGSASVAARLVPRFGIEEVSDREFLLAGQSPQYFTALYDLSSHPDLHATSLFARERPFTFELNGVEYWRNQYYVWRVERRR